MSDEWLPNPFEPPRTSEYWQNAALRRAHDDPKASFYEKRDRIKEAGSEGALGRWSWHELIGRYRDAKQVTLPGAKIGQRLGDKK